MTLSYCVPCHKREADLREALPALVAAANASPPVELVIVDYGQQPSLEPLVAPFRDQLIDGNALQLPVYRGREHYHMAHARNLSIQASTGDVLVLSCADIVPYLSFFSTIRTILTETGADYIRSDNKGYPGLVTVRREVIFALRGYDERFEFYGPEDKDLLHRLARSGAIQGTYHLDDIMRMIVTPWPIKLMGYRAIPKPERHVISSSTLQDNDMRNVIAVNTPEAWGRFDS